MIQDCCTFFEPCVYVWCRFIWYPHWCECCFRWNMLQCKHIGENCQICGQNPTMLWIHTHIQKVRECVSAQLHTLCLCIFSWASQKASITHTSVSFENQNKHHTFWVLCLPPPETRSSTWHLFSSTDQRPSALSLQLPFSLFCCCFFSPLFSSHL